MSTRRRITAASAAAVLGLFLAGCDDTGTEEAPESPAETTSLDEDVTTPPTVTETQLGGTETTGPDGTVTEGEAGGAGTGAEDMVPEPDPGDEAMDAGTGY